MPSRQRSPYGPLTVLQINVGRRAISHKLALTLAHNSYIDILFIQELYIFADHSKQITKRHLAYKAFTPLDNWTIRPRAIIYVRKGRGLCISQLQPALTRDIVFLQLQSRNSLPVTLINIYNAPTGSTNANEAINTLLTLSFRRSSSTFLAGDLNLHGLRWNPLLTTTESPPTDAFTD